MREKFFGYMAYSEEIFNELWNDSIFVLDANILLNLYRYSKETQEKVLECLQKVSDRLWLPYNTAQEFFNNRINVMLEQRNIYSSIKKDLNLRAHKDLIQSVRHITLDSKKKQMIEVIEECEKQLKAIIEEDELKFEESNENRVLDKILQLFEGKVGEKIPEEELKKMKVTIEARYKEGIPPGFKDAKKPKESRRYGDCLNWFSIMDYAKLNEKNIIYITDDNKEDWFLTINGKKQGPRSELLQEFYERTSGKKVYIYNTNGFLKSFNEFIERGAELSDKITSEISEIIEEDNSENGISDYEFIRNQFYNNINRYLINESEIGINKKLHKSIDKLGKKYLDENRMYNYIKLLDYNAYLERENNGFCQKCGKKLIYENEAEIFKSCECKLKD